MEVYGFKQCLGWRCSPISTFFSLVKSREFRYAPHSQVWFWDFRLCLLDFQNLLDLALSQIYTRVFHLWKSIDLDSAWLRDSRQYQLSFLSKVVARLEMRHTRVLGAVIHKNAYITFLRRHF